MKSLRKDIAVRISFLLVVFIIVFIYSCAKFGNGNYSSNIDYTLVPEGFPPIPFPEDNPYSPEKVELGRRLFYEKLLSKDSTISSCSHCMEHPRAFSDDIPMSRGFQNEPEFRNAMSLVNVAYRKSLFWDGRGKRIEEPAYRSLWLPMILGADTNEIQVRLENHPPYPKLFEEAFGSDAKPTARLISKAIATFVRTFISGNSPYDQYIRGNKEALNESEIRGMNLFFSERTRCAVCHTPPFFIDGKLHNTGMNTHYFDRGLFFLTGKNEDRGLFITPTLRNIEVTAPYMHDGTLNTLIDVIDHYNHGGKKFINKDTLMRPLNLNYREKADLIAFLKALTDEEFLNDPRFSKPE
jgi:cytochrome c peroxidase